MFADDSFLFCKATTAEANEVRAVLQKYELQSGQAINLQKSGIYFSANVRLDKQEEIKELLRIHNESGSGHYLGLPSLIGRSKKMVFNFLKDRIWNKIQRWSVTCLSRAGKAVLLSNVAQAIPSYAMSCFLIPKSLCSELERMMNNFWWGTTNSSRKGIRWLSWSNMSMPKCEGGLGFRNLHGFNLALLGKHCWHFIHNPGSLIARIFKARYYPHNSLFEATRGGGASYIWSGLWQAKEELKHGFRWVIGNGEKIKVFEDSWLKGGENYKVENICTDRVNVTRVCDLFVPGEKYGMIKR